MVNMRNSVGKAGKHGKSSKSGKSGASDLQGSYESHLTLDLHDDDDRDGCCDLRYCQVCEIGYHERCKNGCVVAANW